MNIILKSISFVVLFVLFSSGCASTPTPAPVVKKKRIFFPPPPVEPKIEFLGVFQSQHQFPKTNKQRWMDRIFGAEPAKVFKRPFGIVSNGKGKVYVSDIDLNTIFIYDLINYQIKLFTGGGAFDIPMGMALDKAGNLYVADVEKQLILVFDENEQPLISFGEKGKNLDWPVGIAVDDKRDRVYVANSHGHNITVFSRSGEYQFTIGRRGGGDGNFNYPIDVDIASDGSIVVSDSMNARIQIFDPSGKFLRKFGDRGDSSSSFDLIKGVALDSDDHIYVADSMGSAIKIFDCNGN